MNNIYLWVVTAISAAIGLETIFKLFVERERLVRDDLADADRMLVCRIILFLILPLMILADLRATMVACQWFGGYLHHWSYGFLWYTGTIQSVSAEHLPLVLFAGAIAQVALSLCLLFSLTFRPHPFFATLVGYTALVVFAVVLLEPIGVITGIGSSRWSQFHLLSPATQMMIGTIYGAAAILYLMLVKSAKVRLWFTSMSRPLVAEELEDAVVQSRLDPQNPHSCTRLALLYDRTGLGKQSKAALRKLETIDQSRIYLNFVRAVLSYKQRKYAQAKQAFLITSEYQHLDPQTRAALLSAAACAAFADKDLDGALNLSERALEFDDASLMARMVKIDVFMRTQRKEQAGQEIIAAIRRGLDLDFESQVPLDTDRVLQKITRSQKPERRAHMVARL